jgi:type IV pilus assembly protein PilY1
MKDIKHTHIIYQLAAALLFVLFVAVPPQAVAGKLAISDEPLFLVTNVPPNLLLTIDDSGSMSWAYAPDGIAWTDGQPEFHSPYFNPLYYNPDVTYTQPIDENGVSLTTSFNNAWIYGFDHSRGSIDLNSLYRATKVYNNGTGSETHTGLYSNVQRAYYYQFDPTLPNCDRTQLNSVNHLETDNHCYTFVSLPAAQEQNFANWYSFYRTRSMATASAASLAFGKVNGETRVGFQLLGYNTCGGFTSTCSTYDSAVTVDSRIRKFGGTHKAGFYNWLTRLYTNNGTPLRQAMKRAGEYYKTSEPYRIDPAVSGGQVYSCRQNYHIMMTDGVWNGGTPSSLLKDDVSRTLPDGVTYTGALPPYKSTTDNTLADVAFTYWATDLNTSLANSETLKYMPVSLNETVTYGGSSNVMTPYWNPRNDPATWQHMVNFLVAVGLNSTLITDPIQWQGDTYASSTTDGKGYNPLASGNTSWPAAGSNNLPANVYDLWHAALDSRGQFFSADTPQAIVDAFKTIINRIQERQGSASNLSFNAGSVSSNTQFYQSLFDSSVWKGHLLALPLSDGSGTNLTCTTEARGDVCPTKWDAAGVLTGGDYKDPRDPSRTLTNGTAIDWNTGRVILTYNGTAGKPFRWADLTTSQKTALENGGSANLGQATLEYLRGNRHCEELSSVACDYDTNGDSIIDASDDVLRERTSLLGDIVNSSPVYVGNPERNYPTTFNDLLNSNTDNETDYSVFAKTTGKGTRLNVVYVGANDGMLHGFRTGRLVDSNSNTIIDPSDGFDNTLNDGREVLAYVPSKVYDNLPSLADPNYSVVSGSHRFYVDGEMEVVDAYFGSAWHSVLVSSLGAGGQGLFALDVTDPENDFKESNASNIVLWEFNDSDDQDLGYTLGQPNVVRLHNGEWGVIVGNGYNNTYADGNTSTSGDAVLFVIRVSDGAVLAKLDTGVGSSLDPTGAGRPNGLGSVTPIDLDGDVVTDFVYAADLFGNVWRFDLTDADPTKWIVSYGSSACASDGTSACEPLFTAYDTSSPSIKAQPITTKLLADKHPNGLGYGVMVYFGTGKYFETVDNVADTSTFNTFYGVWDTEFSTFNALSNGPDVGTQVTQTKKWGLRRADLLQQTIDFEGLDPATGDTLRIVSDNAIDWSANADQGCYLDLRSGNSSLDASGHIVNATSWTNNGELVAADPLIVGDAVVVPTLIPNSDACSTGGDGWIMAIDKTCGGHINALKRIFDKRTVQGIHYGKAPPGTPAFISKQLYIPLGEGSVAQMSFDAGAEGRKSWVQLK